MSAQTTTVISGLVLLAMILLVAWNVRRNRVDSREDRPRRKKQERKKG